MFDLNTKHFTADCGVILESVQDHGIATQDDIYCKRCHNDRFAALEFAEHVSYMLILMLLLN